MADVVCATQSGGNDDNPQPAIVGGDGVGGSPLGEVGSDESSEEHDVQTENSAPPVAPQSLPLDGESTSSASGDHHILDDAEIVARLMALVEEMNIQLDDQRVNCDPDVGAIVESIVASLIVPSATYIRNDQDMEIIAQELLGHPIVDADVDAVLRFLVSGLKDLSLHRDYASRTIADLDCGYILLSILYHLGNHSANVFRKVSDLDGLELLKPIVLHQREHRIHHPAVKLLFELCQVQELSLSELAELDDELIVAILSRIEATRLDALEEYNYSLIHLILAISYQFNVKNHARNVVTNRVISNLSSRLHLGKTLGENIIFMLNRAEDERIQRLILRFFNDLRVILDVILRECRALSENDTQLQQSYLIIIPFLVKDPLLEGYKVKDVFGLLNDLRRSGSLSSSPSSPSACGRSLPESPTTPGMMIHSDGSRPSTRKVAEKVFLECRNFFGGLYV
ncbi:hypothetical protein DFJ73DRAFT_450121 [Zopfochytrium polystomum]|nr:hypothetical protein DFJ73DRAFT_450121 [Zopfochytrium polystomum]